MTRLDSTVFEGILLAGGSIDVLSSKYNTQISHNMSGWHIRFYGTHPSQIHWTVTKIPVIWPGSSLKTCCNLFSMLHALMELCFDILIQKFSSFDQNSILLRRLNIRNRGLSVSRALQLITISTSSDWF